MPEVGHARIHVGRLDWSVAATAASATSLGLARQVIVGPSVGAVHTELAAVSLAPGGWLQRHLHAFEEAIYVLEGELLLELDGHVHRLQAADYAVMPVGTWHALGNDGGGSTRFLSVNSPVRVAADAGRRDTFFDDRPFDLDAFAARSARPAFGHPSLRLVGHYAGTPPQAEALAVADAARGRKPAGMDTALLAYSGISVKMLVDRGLGADLLTMFTVDYEPGGAAQVHDHPFEEAYVFLDGEVEGELDGQLHRLGPGDVVWAGVGATHGFFNTGGGRVRWIETQAPQPPARHAYRWLDQWRALEGGPDGR